MLCIFQYSLVFNKENFVSQKKRCGRQSPLISKWSLQYWNQVPSKWLLANGVHGNSTTQPVTKAINCFSQQAVRPYCWRQHLQNLLNSEKWSWCHIEPSPLQTIQTSLLSTGSYSACYQRGRAVSCSCPDIIRETFSCSRYEQIQRFIGRHERER